MKKKLKKKMTIGKINKKLKPIIGWRENIAIPSLGVKNIKVKVDTGARTSALHVSNLRLIKRGKSEFAEFTLHPKQRSATPKIKTRSRVRSFKLVKSSNGIS